jgi:ABC-2 type transport system permease protein
MTTLAGAGDRTRPSPLAGWAVVARLAVRRERLPIGIWGLATVISVLSSVSAIASLYAAPAARTQLALTISANPAFLALNGPLQDTSIGGVAAWRIGVYGALAVGYMSASTVIRRTRAEEESGRAELLASGVLGRSSPLAVALLLAGAAALAVGIVCALGCIAQGQPVGGSFALGAALAGPGLVFAALAGVAAQVFESARAALSAAGLSLGVAYAIRGIADSWSSLHWLSWLSPLGWSQRLDPYGSTRWWVLLLFLAAAAALVGVALRLLGARDIGLGLFAARPGPARSRRLRSGATLAARLHRSPLVGWSIGLAVFGALTGSLAGTAGSLLTDNAKIEQIVQQVGGVGAPSDELFAVMGALAGLLTAAYAVAAALQVRSEESSGRAELTLSTSLSRSRLLAGHLVFSLAGAAVLLSVAGLAAGVVYGAQSGDLGTGIGTGVSAMAVQIPAVLVVAGLTAALIGWFPRRAAIAWAALGVFALLGQLGQTLGLPQALLDLSPFSHVPPLPAGAFTMLPVAVLLLVTAVATAIGFVGFRRRDIG